VGVYFFFWLKCKPLIKCALIIEITIAAVIVIKKKDSLSMKKTMTSENWSSI